MAAHRWTDDRGNQWIASFDDPVVEYGRDRDPIRGPRRETVVAELSLSDDAAYALEILRLAKRVEELEGQAPPRSPQQIVREIDTEYLAAELRIDIEAFRDHPMHIGAALLEAVRALKTRCADAEYRADPDALRLWGNDRENSGRVRERCRIRRELRAWLEGQRDRGLALTPGRLQAALGRICPEKE